MGNFYYLSMECDSVGCFILHSRDCKSLPDKNFRLFIGTFYHPRDALLTAKYRELRAKPCGQCLSDIAKGQAKKYSS